MTRQRLGQLIYRKVRADMSIMRYWALMGGRATVFIETYLAERFGVEVDLSVLEVVEANTLGVVFNVRNAVRVELMELRGGSIRSR